MLLETARLALLFFTTIWVLEGGCCISVTVIEEEDLTWECWFWSAFSTPTVCCELTLAYFSIMNIAGGSVGRDPSCRVALSFRELDEPSLLELFWALL